MTHIDKHLHVAAHESHVTITETSWGALVDLITNEAQALTLTHRVLAPKHTSNQLGIALAADETLEVHVSIKTSTQRRRLPAMLTEHGDAIYCATNIGEDPIDREISEELTEALCMLLARHPNFVEALVDRISIQKAAYAALYLLRHPQIPTAWDEISETAPNTKEQ